jgi:sulfate permease, SulP family
MRNDESAERPAIHVTSDPVPRASRVQVVARYLPIVRWLPAYPRKWLGPDLVSSVTSWGVMVPVALAYAGLAGVPPEIGLVTAFTALATYAILGTSRHLKVTASSTVAVMSASVVAPLALGDVDRYVGLTAALALIVGVMLLAAGLLRLGFLSEFLAKPVVTGFIIGVAISIVVGQLPKLFGVPGVSGSVFDQLRQFVTELPQTNPWTLALGVGSIVVIVGLRLIDRRIPSPLVALVGSIALVSVFGLTSQGVQVVGEVATGLPVPHLPDVGFRDLAFLATGAAGIVFLALSESIGAARAFATRHGDRIDPDQELVALGGSNLTSGLFGGFTVDASLSQSAASEAAGARSQLSSLATAGLLLATLIVLAPLFANLPQAVLGAIVITSALSLVDVAELRRYVEWRRTDFALAVVAAVGVLATSVLVGMVIAAFVSVVVLLFRASKPVVAVLGRIPGTHPVYGDLTRHEDAKPVPGIAIVRLDAPLYYFNATEVQAQVLARLEEQVEPPRWLVLDLGATSDLDVTTTDMLTELLQRLGERGVELALAQAKGQVRDRMRRTGLMGAIGEERVFLSVGAAVVVLSASGASPAARGEGTVSPSPGEVPPAG